jgi:intracellular sulfur oxidation DsrE/DsrF family protein
MNMATNAKRRRQLIAGLGTTAAAVALGVPAATAQTAAAPFQPSHYEKDDWFATRRGKHRVILDTVSSAGVADAIRFANNLFTGSKTGYSVDDSDMAIVICLRHRATSHAYPDAIWAKYSRALDRSDELGSTAPPSTVNTYNTGERPQLSELAKRGVLFMVCAQATRGIATRAAGPNGNVDAVFKELESNLLTSGHLVATGVVGVLHAQEHGYRYLYVG